MTSCMRCTKSTQTKSTHVPNSNLSFLKITSYSPVKKITKTSDSKHQKTDHHDHVYVYTV